MQCMNSSLDKLIKNLSDEDFRYLVEEFGSENLELLKQKGAITWIVLKDLMKKNCLLDNIFLVQQKMEKLMMMVKYQMVTEVLKIIWLVKNCDKFEMKNMGDYHSHYLKKDVLLLADFFEKFIDTCS